MKVNRLYKICCQTKLIYKNRIFGHFVVLNDAHHVCRQYVFIYTMFQKSRTILIFIFICFKFDLFRFDLITAENLTAQERIALVLCLEEMERRTAL